MKYLQVCHRPDPYLQLQNNLLCLDDEPPNIFTNAPGHPMVQYMASTWPVSTMYNTSFHCVPPQDSSHLGYNMYAAILAFIIPTFTIICFYVAIALKLKKYHTSNKQTNECDVLESHEEKEVLKDHNSSLPSPKVTNFAKFPPLVIYFISKCRQ